LSIFHPDSGWNIDFFSFLHPAPSVDVGNHFEKYSIRIPDGILTKKKAKHPESVPPTLNWSSKTSGIRTPNHRLIVEKLSISRTIFACLIVNGHDHVWPRHTLKHILNTSYAANGSKNVCALQFK